MVAEIQELPANVSARAAISEGTDAEYAARLGLVMSSAPTPEPAKVVEEPEVKPETVASEETVTEEVAEGEQPPEEPAKEPEPEKPLLTKFEVYDAEGEVEVPRELKFNFKANGKDLKEVPLEKVVLLAQQGVYNHEKEQRIQQLAKDAEQKIATAEEAAKLATEYEKYYEAIFEDPEFYEKARTEFMKSKTPEAEAARLKQEIANRDRNDAEQRAIGTRAQLVTQVLVPHMVKLLEQNATVSQDELLGRWHTLTAPYMIRGEIPVERLATVRTLAEHELTQWAQSVHLERAAAAAEKDKSIKAAKREVNTAKRQVARATAPTGNTPPSTQKPKETASARDWYSDRFGG